MTDIHQLLKTYWGFDAFRPLQQAIIESVLQGTDTLALLPTGGGKSVCYQVPALAKEGICLVVSPLIALMKDQVENLKKKHILAAAIYTGMSRRQVVQVLKNVAYGPYKFLYVSPERLETDLFQEFLPALHVNLIAVDEAHCISQWGHDFRPAYRRIAALRRHLPGVPVLALTASATAAVQQDVCTQLQFAKPQVLRQPFQRPNISYSVFKVEARIHKLQEILSKVPGTAIVYCNSRKRTVETAHLLQLNGINAEAYHAGLSADLRTQRQEAWMQNRLRVMVCTNAFGMGIDKPDVRVVVHLDVPDCLENYYQEAGRAGRDGKKAYAVLLVDSRAVTELEQLHETRYPNFEQIKTVYGALVNFLQIPNYTGQDTAFDFRFEVLVKNFSLNPQQALYALKALEQDGWFDFNEKSFSPSSVQFTASRDGLFEFYAAHPHLEPLLTTLLRTYEGVFDFPAAISERQLARLLRKHDDVVVQQLREAAAFGILQYQPQTDAPQLIFRKLRVPAGELTMNHAAYLQRKENFRLRVQQMLQYLETAACRSRFINQYFGDAETNACGSCDNCLRQKHTPLTEAEFQAIHAGIETCLLQAALTVAELQQQLPAVAKEKLRQVLRFLETEQQLHTDAGGRLHLR